MKNAIVTKVSVSGANEKLKIEDVIKFLKDNPQAELGIPISKKNCYEGSPLFVWITKLLDAIEADDNLCVEDRLAYHICGDLALEIAQTGKYWPPVNQLLFHNMGKANPSYARIQLNIAYPKYNFNDQDPQPLAKGLAAQRWLPVGRTILQVNASDKQFVDNLANLTDNFDVLYDESHGSGKAATNYKNDYPQIFQGYAGGLCAENIGSELAKIDAALGEPTEIWVDAEGKLKTEDGSTLDLAKAEAFVKAALAANSRSAEETKTNASDSLIPLPPEELDPWAKYEMGEEEM